MAQTVKPPLAVLATRRLCIAPPRSNVKDGRSWLIDSQAPVFAKAKNVRVPALLGVSRDGDKHDPQSAHGLFFNHETAGPIKTASAR
jgi:hypothetical protein